MVGIGSQHRYPPPGVDDASRFSVARFAAEVDAGIAADAAAAAQASAAHNGGGPGQAHTSSSGNQPYHQPTAPEVLWRLTMAGNNHGSECVRVIFPASRALFASGMTTT
jgi:hypothetical protein